jgi:hypothetical protein
VEYGAIADRGHRERMTAVTVRTEMQNAETANTTGTMPLTGGSGCDYLKYPPLLRIQLVYILF